LDLKVSYTSFLQEQFLKMRLCQTETVFQLELELELELQLELELEFAFDVFCVTLLFLASQSLLVLNC